MKRVLQLVTLLSALASSQGASITTLTDLEFARAGERSLKLDLYIPAQKQKSPLIVWVHGGAWRSGTKSEMPLLDLVREGWPDSSVQGIISFYGAANLTTILSQSTPHGLNVRVPAL